MAFQKKTWKNRLSEFPNRRRLEPTGIENTYDVVRAEGNVTETGDAFSEDSMNDLEERIATGLADGAITTALHTRTGTTNNLDIPTGAKNLTFLATAANADGDSWTINGNPVTAVLQNGEVLPGELFKSGCWVTGVRLSDDGTQLFFKSAGGDKVTYNVFCQPTEPTSKTGIWLKTDTTIKPKKIVFDDNIWAAGGWQNPSLIKDAPSSGVSTGACIINGLVYVTFFGRTYEYDLSKNSYDVGTPYPVNRGSAPLCAANGEIYTFGGVVSSQASNSALAFNPSTKIFRDIASMAVACSGAIVVEADGNIYIYGGHNTSSQTLTKVEKYNLQTNTYTTISNLPKSEMRFGADYYNGKVYMFGGPNTVLMNYIHNLASDTYSVNTNPGMYYTVTVIRRLDKIILLGGRDASNNYLTTVKEYDPSNNSFKILASMPTARLSGAAVVTSDKLLIFGTTDSSKTVDCMEFTDKQYPNDPSVLLYNPKTDLSFNISILTSKFIDALPVLFKDSMLFADGDITFPALYIGDGMQWTLARAAQ